MRALLISTVAQNLVFQAPSMLRVLREEGYDVTFATGRDSWIDDLALHGPVIELPLSRQIRLSQLAASARKLKHVLAQDWDLVQVQSPIAGLVARATSGPRPGRSSLYVAHGFHFHADGRPWTNAAFRTVERALAGRTDAVAVVSQEDFEAASRLGFARRTTLWRLPGAGVDLDLFSPGHGTRPRTVLFCGELNDNKDPLFAVRVVEEARASGADLSLTLIGEGPLAAQVDAAQREHPWITWRPRAEPSEVADAMRSSAALLAPSRREGLPRVVIEAIATGLPVLARSNRGTRELLHDGLGGRIMSTDDPHQWAIELVSLAAEPLPAAASGSMSKYSVDAFDDSYRNLLRRLASPSRPHAVDLDQQTGT